MHLNNTIYKGYRLSALVDRVPREGAGAILFKASIVVSLPGEPVLPDNTYPVPQFDSGVSVSNPAQAVHAAVAYGRQVVDSMNLGARRG
ncbi:hypothetical protein [Bordetella bronchialis]|uniref:Uncharacterized protein n=1 Tax=Bordetella bronchialis TaxID=463025 RepID=A0A193FHG1_9BORD|nr:hypothetical protein [Bordetella bronchialis]ANN67172.1 hypothetical protein BAU06_13495 [Bordetella bronchialis]ANN72258.1 hypothetical protein BAU08_13715 [Bordetella bronchialis]